MKYERDSIYVDKNLKQLCQTFTEKTLQKDLVGKKNGREFSWIKFQGYMYV